MARISSAMLRKGKRIPLPDSPEKERGLLQFSWTHYSLASFEQRSKVARRHETVRLFLSHLTTTNPPLTPHLTSPHLVTNLHTPICPATPNLSISNPKSHSGNVSTNISITRKQSANTPHVNPLPGTTNISVPCRARSSGSPRHTIPNGCG